MPDTPPASAPLAAIDIGSNSFRLEIGQLQHGRYRRIDYLKETVRLGAGLDASGRLDEAATQRGLDTLARFAERLGGFATAQVRAVATQTLREATNRDAFLERARGVLGHPIEVISGREEARLIYAGVAHLQPSDERRLVIDIGGRSTEMILGRARTPLAAESFNVGSVSLSMRWFPDGVLTASAFRAAQVAAAAELEEGVATFSPKRWDSALGSSGTAGAVSQLLLASGQTDGTITPAGLAWCIERCIAAGHVDRLDFPGLKADRRAVLPGGLAILYTLAAQFRIGALAPAKGALRQGVIVEMHERRVAAGQAYAADVRDASVRELQRRFAVDTAQAQRVREVAAALYRAGEPQADAEAQRELGWAADLHELGMMVSHHDHHRHAAYLLGHADAPGFSQGQQRRLAALVLGHRGGLRKMEAQLAQPAFAWQLLCLRLAVIRCHGRGPARPPQLGLQRLGSTARLHWSPVDAQLNPQTVHLLQEEAAAWERQEGMRLVIDGSL